MSLEYIRVLDDRISSLLKVEGLVITILVATVSITLSFGMLIAILWIIISLILFLLFFGFTLFVYAVLSSSTFKKREELSRKEEALSSLRVWQEDYDRLNKRYSEFLRITEQRLPREEFIETQDYVDLSDLIKEVYQPLLNAEPRLSYGRIRDVLIVFHNYLNKEQNMKIKNDWSKKNSGFIEASRRIYETIRLEYEERSQLSKKSIKKFEWCVFVCYIFFAVAIIANLGLFILTISTLPVTSN